eukprot:GEMP01055075.1.p1 GENE.GEMP01055075.1~~GEMP01055075.1.p1  ORF type:complete len:282 (+),score=35.32 GEMP01055075.1:177-1022(+)
MYSTAERRGPLDFKQLRLSSFEPIADATRQQCPKCKSSRKVFCYDCCILLPGVELPSVRLPIQLDIIKHNTEKASKSSAIPLKVLSPDVSIYSFPKMPDWSTENTVLLFPSDDAVPPSLVDWKKVRTAVVVDCTWFQCQSILAHPSVAKLPKVKIASRETSFWRHHGRYGANRKGITAEHLSTAEAAYFLITEVCEASAPYEGQCDDLLFLFSHQFSLIQDTYSQSNKRFRHKPEYVPNKELKVQTAIEKKECDVEKKRGRKQLDASNSESFSEISEGKHI